MSFSTAYGYSNTHRCMGFIFIVFRVPLTSSPFK